MWMAVQRELLFFFLSLERRIKRRISRGYLHFLCLRVLGALLTQNAHLASASFALAQIYTPRSSSSSLLQPTGHKTGSTLARSLSNKRQTKEKNYSGSLPQEGPVIYSYPSLSRNQCTLLASLVSHPNFIHPNPKFPFSNLNFVSGGKTPWCSIPLRNPMSKKNFCRPTQSNPPSRPQYRLRREKEHKRTFCSRPLSFPNFRPERKEGSITSGEKKVSSTRTSSLVLQI